MSDHGAVMIKLIYTLAQWRKASKTTREADRDPLSHPTISAMTPDELADLPFASMRESRTC